MAVDAGLSPSKLIDTVSRRRVYRDVLEFTIVAVAFLLYFLVRGAVVDRHDAAISHAVRVVEIERKLGIFWEPTLNSAILHYGALVQFFNQVYFWLDFPLIVAIGVWMYLFGHRHEYTIARDALLASGAVALIVYYAFPLAPPRLVPAEYGFGFVDTLKKYSSLAYQTDSTAPFVNPYAAMPSLHYGWAVLVGGILFWTTADWRLRAMGVMMPVLQFTSIVFTANHYVLDAVAGLGVGTSGLLIAIALQRWGYPYLRRCFATAAAPPSSA